MEGAVSGPVQCAESTSLPLNATICSSNLCLLGGTRSRGNVMMRQPSGELLPVCDDGWNMAAAHVACRKLGFTRALEAKNGSQYPGIHTDEFALDQVQCRGLEDSLLNCSFTAAEDCDAGEAAGVVCDPTPQQVIADNISQRIESCYARNVLCSCPQCWTARSCVAGRSHVSPSATTQPPGSAE